MMMLRATLNLTAPFLVLVVCQGLSAEHSQAAGPIRSQAVVDLTFDEAAGEALDRSTLGRYKNRGVLKNGARRVGSPFWNQGGKRALLLDAARKQFVEIADSADLDRADAATVGFFFLSLHDAGDAAAHGVFAKRLDSKDKQSANYGTNFVPKNDVFQVYVNHGGGFRMASYSARSIIGAQHRVYLTATFEMGDAPAPDADTDKDDLLIRLYANGQQVKPVKAASATLAGNDVWVTDVDVTKLVNDTPLTLGSSSSTTEHTSCLIDEFTLFARALKPAEVSALFVEVAGANAVKLGQREREVPTTRPAVRITQLTLRGLRAGGTTRLTLRGSNLGSNPRVLLPVGNFRQTKIQNSDAGLLTVDLSLPADAQPGYYPLSIETENGLSNTVIVAVDRLVQLTTSGTSTTNPAPLPSAFSGTFSAAGTGRVYFIGRAGQRIVADVDARRIGARIDPVLELKTEQGTPLAIEWGKVHLKGDARIELVLPEDGIYFVELHDLAYKAPSGTPYRIKIGNLSLIDACFPPSAVVGTVVSLEPIGTGIPSGTLIPTKLSNRNPGSSSLLFVPGELNRSGPAPVVRKSDGTEIVEAPPAKGKLQTVDATFPAAMRTPLAVNGRILKQGEEDRYLVNVVEGRPLKISVEARSIDSPLDGQLRILKHPEGNQLASSDDRPNTRDPGLQYTPPKGTKTIQIAVRDLHGRGGDHYLYRLQIAPASTPGFRINIETPRIELPQGGTAIATLNVTRDGYQGPIKLSVLGDAGVSIAPAQIPAGGGNRKTFVTLTQTGGSLGTRTLSIVGESVGLKPAIRRVARVAPESGNVALPAFDHRLPTLVFGVSDFSIDVTKFPSTLFRGVPSQLTVDVARKGKAAGRVAEFTLSSNEPTRRVDSRNASKGNKPRIRADKSVFGTSRKSGIVRVAVPLDVAVGEIDFVVRADLRKHAYSKESFGIAFSQPVRLPVRNAVAINFDTTSLQIVAGTESKVRGKVIRTAGFSGSIDVALTGLPKGYRANKVTVPPDAQQFEIVVTVPKEEKAKDLPKIGFTVSRTGGGPVLPRREITLKVTAGK